MVEIARTKENLYKENCPIIVKSAVLNKEDENFFANVCMKNVSLNSISSVMLDFHVFNIANNEIEVVRDYLYVLQNVPRDSEFGEEIAVSFSSQNAFTLAIAVRKVEFANEEEWVGTPSILFETIPNVTTLSDFFCYDELIEQFKRDFSENFLSDKKNNPEILPYIYKNLWFCSCGAVNQKDESGCHRCGANLKEQLVYLNDREQIDAHLIAYKKQLAIDIEKARNESKLKMEAAQKAQEKAIREAQEEKERYEKEKKRKRKTKILSVLIGVPTAVLLAVYLYLLFVYILPNQKYEEAVAMMDENKFEESITKFQELGDFSDSQSMVVEAKYQQAQYAIENKEYDLAIAIFDEISVSRDIGDGIKEVSLQKALDMYDDGEYQGAIDSLTSIEEYENAKEIIANCYLKLAENSVDDIAVSSAYFKKLTGSQSTQIQELYYEKGEKLYSEDKVAEAEKYFSYVSDSSIVVKINKIHYDEAIGYIDSNNLEEAEQLLSQLGEYEDSKEQLLKIDYLKGEAYVEAGNYESALASYEKAGEYSDSTDKIKLCKYNLALAEYNKASYENAIALFEEISDYSDSDYYLEQSKYKYGVQLLNSGEVIKSYEVLYDIKHNIDAYTLLVTTSAYYLYVYEKNIGPNPLYEGQEN